jgi:hypothetical protein
VKTTVSLINRVAHEKIRLCSNEEFSNNEKNQKIDHEFSKKKKCVCGSNENCIQCEKHKKK